VVGYARRSAGPLSWARAPSPASASPCPCWSPASRSPEPPLDDAKLGLLGAAALAPALTWIVIRATQLLPCPQRITALLGGTAPLIDLAYDVDPARDHIRGPLDAPVTVLEYGDFECPFCGRAEPQVRELLRDFSDVRYVWRHLPLSDVHLHAQMAAEAAEAAAAQNAFWPMHDLLLAHQDALQAPDLHGYAQRLGLDVERFASDLEARRGAERVAEDVEGADLSGVTGTPTFFVNGLRHYGPYDIVSLDAAVRSSEAHVRLLPTGPRSSSQGAMSARL
jgi:protein-disulfide isomerase